VSAGHYRFVSTDRRVRGDRRFVAGKGRFVADIDLPNTKHIALVTCPHAAARIISIGGVSAPSLRLSAIVIISDVTIAAAPWLGLAVNRWPTQSLTLR
jgi:2-furoyl-CoA dehydrogenase large subunit